MQAVSYYLEQAERAERLASLVTDKAIEAELRKMAQDYRDIAQDLQNGAIEIRHPDLMPQKQHQR
jgi:hypothetical protein